MSSLNVTLKKIHSSAAWGGRAFTHTLTYTHVHQHYHTNAYKRTHTHTNAHKRTQTHLERHPIAQLPHLNAQWLGLPTQVTAAAQTRRKGLIPCKFHANSMQIPCKFHAKSIQILYAPALNTGRERGQSCGQRHRGGVQRQQGHLVRRGWR